MTRKQMNRIVRKIPFGGSLQIEMEPAVLTALQTKVSRQLARTNASTETKSIRRDTLRRETGVY